MGQVASRRAGPLLVRLPWCGALSTVTGSASPAATSRASPAASRSPGKSIEPPGPSIRTTSERSFSLSAAGGALASKVSRASPRCSTVGRAVRTGTPAASRRARVACQAGLPPGPPWSYSTPIGTAPTSPFRPP